MANFITALIKQRNDAKKSEPDTNGRLKEIIDIIRKYDYEDGITPEILVGIIQDLGPTFVKIGQIASQQSESIPPEYCDALAKLRSSVAPMDMETVHAQIEKHLGKPASEIFASFDDKPLGSASIAQVHRAVLPDGTVVAVKVRRPGVVDTVARDFALIEKVIDTFFKNGLAGFDIKSFIVELEKTSKTELDFTNEAANIDRFYELNLGRPGVESPKCYRDYTNEAILTEDFVTGTEVSDVDFLATLDDDERDRLASLVADNFADQVLVDGFYHADPHSGNVIVKPPVPHDEDEADEAAAEAEAEVEGDEAAVEAEAEDEATKLPEHGIEWIDFGMMGTLSQQQRQILLDLVTSIVMQDAYGLKRTLLKVSKPKGEIDHGAMLELCEGMCDNYTGSDFGEFDLGSLLSTILTNLQDESYDIDPFLTNLARGIIAVEGTVKTLSPRINILNNFLAKVDVGIGLGIDFDNLDSEALAEMNPVIAMKLLQFFDSVSKAEDRTAQSLDMLEKGQLRLHTNYSIEDKTLAAVTRLVKYAIRAVISAALFIGSCILCTIPANVQQTPLFYSFYVIGSIGCLVSVFFFYRLIGDMKKNK